MDQRLCHRPTKCPMDRLPVDILVYILCLLSITDLLRARGTCRAWHRIISSSNIFHRLYDQRNHESWIALTSPHRICLFNNNSNKSYFFPSRYQANPTKCWLLQGAADGLLFLVDNDGKMFVVNPLTRRFRCLPDTKVSPRLRLESCLKRKLWGSDSTAKCVQPSMSINIVADDGGKTFKVMVWGELRTNQVHALVFSSATDKWTVRLCSNISYKLFRYVFHTSVDGNNIVYSSMQPTVVVLANYDTETGFFNVNGRVVRVGQSLYGFMVYRHEYTKMIVYKGRIFLLSVMVCRRQINVNLRRSFSLIGLWLENSSLGRYELLSKQELQFPLDQVEAAYDGKDSITIISRMWGSKMLSLNLDTKEWRFLDADTEAWRLADGNAQQHTFSPAAFRAFYLKLKFCTAVY